MYLFHWCYSVINWASLKLFTNIFWYIIICIRGQGSCDFSSFIYSVPTNLMHTFIICHKDRSIDFRYWSILYWSVWYVLIRIVLMSHVRDQLYVFIIKYIYIDLGGWNLYKYSWYMYIYIILVNRRLWKYSQHNLIQFLLHSKWVR